MATINIQRIFTESEILSPEDRSKFESFVLGWFAGLCTAEETEEAIRKAYEYLERTNRRKIKPNAL